MQDKIKIAIVDDQPLFRQGVKQVIKRFPQFSLLGEANSAMMLIRSLDEQAPGAVILDIDDDIQEETMFIKRNFPKVKILIPILHSPETLHYQRIKRAAHATLMHAKSKELGTQAKHSYIGLTEQLDEFIIPPMLNDLLAGKDMNFPQILLSLIEKKIIALITLGYNNAEIATILFRSVRTVEEYRWKILEKIGGEATADIIAYGIRNKLDIKFGFTKLRKSR